MNIANTEARFYIYLRGDRLMMHWDRGGYDVRVRVANEERPEWSDGSW